MGYGNAALVTKLRHASERLFKEFEKGKFTPRHEYDIQRYLYHLLLLEKGIKPKDIHAEVPYDIVGMKGKKLDLQLGDTRNKNGSVYIEIKTFNTTTKYVKKGLSRIGSDINKLVKRKRTKLNRKLVILYFGRQVNGNSGFYIPISKVTKKDNELRKLRKLVKSIDGMVKGKPVDIISNKKLII